MTPMPTFKHAALAASLLLICMQPAHADSPGAYVPETDKAVLRKLDQWQDWKFGFMVHWGPYSQWGIVESWSICSEDVDWCKRPDDISYVDYVKKYEQLPTTFNPVKFDPDAWAKVARDAGTKYVVFTTKHHDGFSMFDTAQSDYRITAPNVPFHGNSRANISKEVFNAFRKQGFGIGAYFSKPDWHNDDYWWPRFATPNRHVNYDPRKHPERWKKFVDFTHAQVNELTSQYGTLDILWLDGGWVRPERAGEDAHSTNPAPGPQDIDMPSMVTMARRNQPGLIVVDRAVGGPYENYRTPEQKIPELPLPYPWETCMTLGESWSFVPNDKYKSARSVVHMLVDVVAKGGNYLLNIGADANGELPPEAVKRMQQIGQWMRINGDAIYASRAVAPYSSGKFRYTRMRNGDVYAIYLADEGERELPATLTIPAHEPAAQQQVQLLGSDTPLAWERKRDGIVVSIPAQARHANANAYAWAFRLPSAAAQI